MVNHDIQGPLYMKLLAKIIDYAATTHKKVMEEHALMRKIIWNNGKQAKQAEQDFTDAQEECLRNQAKCERLQTSLKTANKHSNTKQHTQKIRAHRTEEAQIMGLLDDATAEIIWLRHQLVDLRQQTPKTVAGPVRAQNYCPRGIRPKELLTGQDVGAYALWEHEIKEKLCTNAVIYTEQKDFINYALQQTIQLIFQQISSWACANKDTLTIEHLF